MCVEHIVNTAASESLLLYKIEFLFSQCSEVIVSTLDPDILFNVLDQISPNIKI